MDEVFVELCRHKKWSILLLLGACAALSDDELASTAPGTYGTIRETLEHLVEADESYYSTVTGEPEALRSNAALSVEELADRFRRLAPRWEAIARQPQVARREVRTSDGWRMPAAIPMAQAIHHADDHRSHVLSILGANGISLDGLDIGEGFDVWHFGIDSGLIVRDDDTGPDAD